MKTARELGLTEEQFNALVMVLEAFRSGKISHINTQDIHAARGVNFNMSRWNAPIVLGCTRFQCGTVCCIGGYASILAGNPDLFGSTLPSRHINENMGLDDLFMLRSPVGRQESVTVEQATVALENYLNTGEALWHKVLGEG